jgi:hypothetical protein
MVSQGEPCAIQPIYAAHIGLGYRALGIFAGRRLVLDRYPCRIRPVPANAVSHRAEPRQAADGLRPRLIPGVGRSIGAPRGEMLVRPTIARVSRARAGTLLALLLLIAPLTAEPQPAEKVYRIGMLETRSTALNAANIDAFRQGLQERGYKEGHNLEIVYRPSDGRDGRFPGLASELVSLKADLILTRGTPGALAAKSATRTIPVVMTIRCSGPAAPAAERRRSPAELGVADRDRRAYSVGT